VPLAVTPDPNLKALLQTVGLMDADERIDSSWFQDPIGGLRTILSDPVQRAALRVLLDLVLGSDSGSPDGTEWHPLLDGGAKGNVFLTVTGDVIGLAASIATPTGISPVGVAPTGISPHTRGSVRVPLVDAGGDDLRAIAATPDGPLEITLDLEFDSDAPMDALRVAATVDIEGDAAVRFELDGVDVGGGPETLVVNSDELGRDLVRALETLVRDALGQAAPGADRTADHLLGLLGLDDVLPPLPLERLASDPAALRTWFAGLATTPAHREAWFAHLAGLLGAPAPAADAPLAVELAEFGGAHLDLVAEVRGGELDLGLAIVVPGSAAAVEASATLLTVPLTGTAPVRFATRAAARVRAPGGTAPLVEQPPPPGNPTIRVGAISGGVSFDGTRLVPELRATDILFDHCELA